MADRVRAKVKATEAKLGELKAWKVVQENKLDLTKKTPGRGGGADGGTKKSA